LNSGNFRVKTEAEQQIWNECSRLIANAIIYYNTLLLSRVYEQKLAADGQEAIKILRGTSPVAWRDVNLIGNFDFAARTSQIDIEALAAQFGEFAGRNFPASRAALHVQTQHDKSQKNPVKSSTGWKTVLADCLAVKP